MTTHNPTHEDMMTLAAEIDRLTAERDQLASDLRDIWGDDPDTYWAIRGDRAARDYADEKAAQARGGHRKNNRSYAEGYKDIWGEDGFKRVFGRPYLGDEREEALEAAHGPIWAVKR